MHNNWLKSLNAPFSEVMSSCSGKMLREKTKQNIQHLKGATLRPVLVDANSDSSSSPFQGMRNAHLNTPDHAHTHTHTSPPMAPSTSRRNLHHPGIHQSPTSNCHGKPSKWNAEHQCWLWNMKTGYFRKRAWDKQCLHTWSGSEWSIRVGPTVLRLGYSQMERASERGIGCIGMTRNTCLFTSGRFVTHYHGHTLLYMIANDSTNQHNEHVNVDSVTKNRICPRHRQCHWNCHSRTAPYQAHRLAVAMASACFWNKMVVGEILLVGAIQYSAK